jgi:hypothetical protein
VAAYDGLVADFYPFGGAVSQAVVGSMLDLLARPLGSKK